MTFGFVSLTAVPRVCMHSLCIYIIMHMHSKIIALTQNCGHHFLLDCHHWIFKSNLGIQWIYASTGIHWMWMSHPSPRVNRLPLDSSYPAAAEVTNPVMAS